MTDYDVPPIRTHEVQAYEPSFRPAYLANGLVGLRLGKYPLIHHAAALNGFIGREPHHGVEAYAPAPNPVAGDLQLGRQTLSDRPDLATFNHQSYDFETGELSATFQFDGDGAAAAIETRTLPSRTFPPLVLQETRIDVDEPCEVIFRSIIDIDDLPGELLLRRHLDPGDRDATGDAVIHYESATGRSTCGASVGTDAFAVADADADTHGPGDRIAQADLDVETRRNDFGHEFDSPFQEYHIDAEPDRTYVLRQMGSLVPDMLHSEPHWQAVRLLDLADWRGFDRLRQQTHQRWADLWESRVKLLGADREWQDCADAAFFYLHSTVHPSTPCGVAPFGLSQRGSGYHGHVFWDNEAFMFFGVLLTNPRAAKALLEYRFDRLDAARNTARLQGYDGALYPWQSGRSGDEVTPVWAGAGPGEHHINMNVANAFAQYVYATDDQIFLEERAWPVLREVADWIVSRVTETDRGYEIHHVMGSDERRANLNNNAYTNITAEVILRTATEMARRLDYDPQPAWIDVADGLVVPIDAERNVLKKHDTFDGAVDKEVLTPYFQFGYSHSEAVDEASFESYVDRFDRAEDEEFTRASDGSIAYTHSPMTGPQLGAYAARVGDRDLAKELHVAGNRPNVTETFHQFRELGPRQTADNGGSEERFAKTTFVSHAGSHLYGLIFGFPGLQLDAGDPRDWPSRPVVLPRGWDGIEIDALHIRGRKARLRAMHGDDRAMLEFID